MSLLTARLLAGFALTLALTAASPDTPAPTRKPAPDFTLTGANGSLVRLSDYKGRVVLLDFWATWCGGCNVEIPWFVEFEDKYKSRGLVVLGVSMDEDGWKKVRPFMERKSMNYQVTIGNEELAKLFQVETLPTTFLIDRQGRIAASKTGLGNKAVLENAINQLLGK